MNNGHGTRVDARRLDTDIIPASWGKSFLFMSCLGRIMTEAGKVTEWETDRDGARDNEKLKKGERDSAKGSAKQGRKSRAGLQHAAEDFLLDHNQTSKTSKLFKPTGWKGCSSNDAETIYIETFDWLQTGPRCKKRICRSAQTSLKTHTQAMRKKNTNMNINCNLFKCALKCICKSLCVCL